VGLSGFGYASEYIEVLITVISGVDACKIAGRACRGGQTAGVSHGEEEAVKVMLWAVPF
jgi:hypothetical protein